jgi:aspartate aminotransferase
MTRLSQRIADIVESQTLAMTKKARELKAAGRDIISLSIGEPDFNTPTYICDAADSAAKQGHTHYPPVAGIPELRAAVCEKLQKENGLRFTDDQIMVSSGAKQSLINAVLALVNPGDEVILPAPYWVSYPTMVQYAGGTVVPIQTEARSEFKASAEQLEAAITDRTRLLIFSSPCNPSGSVMSQEELAAWAEVLKRHPQVFIISDEIYEHIQYGQTHQSLAQFEELRDRLAIVNGFSKGYAMTGWRLGYLAGPKDLVQACDKIQGLFTSGANSVAQWAGVAALRGDQSEVKAMCQTFESRRNLVLQELRTIPKLNIPTPAGAFYVFPDVQAYYGKTTPNGAVIANGEELCLYILEQVGVSCVSGSGFGSPECIRLSYAANEDSLREACARLKQAFASLS